MTPISIMLTAQPAGACNVYADGSSWADNCALGDDYWHDGEYTLGVQQILRADGYAMTLDGQWGANTKQKVKYYQQDNGLTADGIVGTNTWSKLRNQNVIYLDSYDNNAGSIEYHYRLRGGCSGPRSEWFVYQLQANQYSAWPTGAWAVRHYDYFYRFYVYGAPSGPYRDPGMAGQCPP